MNTFRTELSIAPNPQKISYKTRLLSIGSCFSENIAQQLRRRRFQITGNPFGTVFNPLSIFKQLNYCLDKKTPDPNLFIEQENVWSHYDFHSTFSASSKREVEESLIKKITHTADQLNQVDTLIITLGSAFVFELTDANQVVANCHKVPQNKFNKRLITVEEIVTGFRKIYQRLNHIENIILTVSPVRHIKDSLTLNAVSKSTLRLACHQILYEFPHVKYFPAYEFLIDDLRDYRFYENDMLHPNQTAKDYIFEKFLEAYVAEDTKPTVAQVVKLVTASEHRPFLATSEQHQQFLRDTIKGMQDLSDRVDFTALIAELKSQLTD